MDSAERGGNAAVAREVSNEEERRATERKVDARRKGRWPRVERVLLAADRERRTLQAEGGARELGGSGEGAARRAWCGGGSEEKNVSAGEFDVAAGDVAAGDAAAWDSV